MILRCILLTLLLSLGESANILFVIPYTGRSHYIMLKPITTELAHRGHNVTVITSFKEDNLPANYTQVITDAKSIWDVLDYDGANIFDVMDFSYAKFISDVLVGGNYQITETALNSTSVKEFLKNDNHFDLVASSAFYNEALMMFAHKYNAPLVLLTTFGNSLRLNSVLRNPSSFAVELHEVGSYGAVGSFLSRLKTAYFYYYEMFWFYTWNLPAQEALVTKYFPDLPKPVPSLLELYESTSLLLINSHFTVETPKALYPNIIEIGGIHAHYALQQKKNFDMPQDIKDFLDNAKDGVVYMSFGSNLRAKDLTEERKQMFITVFAKLKQRVLWKWEDTNNTAMPPNVKIRPWMPQKEILAHPNIKVFISHGGLIGLQEAMMNGVSILGMPVFFDQYNNILQVVEHGYGLSLNFNDMTEELLSEKLDKLINDERYEKRAKEVARYYLDRPLSPMDTAMFWIEYVIRHKGAEFMKNPGLKMYWWQWYMFDVYLFIVLSVSSIIYGIYRINFDEIIFKSKLKRE